jgi:hypothetical protein
MEKIKYSKIYWFCFLIIIFIRCESGINISVTNKTESKIENLSISNGFNVSTIDSLNPNMTKHLDLDFKKNNTKSDGNYFIKYKYKNEIKVFPFGYYSNGVPSTNEVSVFILNDSIHVE